ncbi:MAG: hypothetical protein QW780_06000 [Sulfolobales archaeon]
MSVFDLVIRGCGQMRRAPILQTPQFSASTREPENLVYADVGGKEKLYSASTEFDSFIVPLDG